jgi:hypothetical protein
MKTRGTLLMLMVVLVVLGVLMVPCQYVRAKAADGIVTTDYFVSHTSIEPFYAQYNLDPHVVIHVREVVMAGRERTVPKDGKVYCWYMARLFRAQSRLISTMRIAR